MANQVMIFLKLRVCLVERKKMGEKKIMEIDG
jgi:hypothetical protein